MLTTRFSLGLARLWDGLTSSSDRIMILGATNRPNDIDAAILRRMPKRYAVSLPNTQQREKILKILLKDARLDKSFKMSEVVRRSQGMSGSDLKEACRNAAMIPVREYLRSKEGRESMSKAKSGSNTPQPQVNGGADGSIPGLVPATSSLKLQTRPLRTEDFFRNDAEMHIPAGQSYNSQNGNKIIAEDLD